MRGRRHVPSCIWRRRCLGCFPTRSGAAKSEAIEVRGPAAQISGSFGNRKEGSSSGFLRVIFLPALAPTGSRSRRRPRGRLSVGAVLRLVTEREASERRVWLESPPEL